MGKLKEPLSYQEFLQRFQNIKGHDSYEIIKYNGYDESSIFHHKKCDKDFEIIPRDFDTKYVRCPFCQRTKLRMTNKEFVSKVQKLVGNEYTFLEEYKTTNVSIKVRHNICNKDYEVRPADFFQGYRCPHCNKNKKMTLNDVSERVKNIDESYSIPINSYNCENFKNVHSKIEFFHNECGQTFLKTFNNFRNGQRCPHCKSKDSKEVIRIINYFEKNNIKYKREVKLEGLKSPNSNKLLRIDFYLIDYDLYIEYDGKQHFEYNKNGYFNEDKFKDIVLKDQIKNDYFKKHNLNLIRISYKEDPISILENLLSSTTIESVS